jgi:hypothetical protein
MPSPTTPGCGLGVVFQQPARSTFGLKYELGMIKRFAYLSQLTFYSEMRLDGLSAALKRLAHGISSEVSKIYREEIPYQTSSIMFQHDPLLRKNPIAAFTIFPRAETPFLDNKYFSEAPVSTDAHIRLLTEFEADVLGKSSA